MKSLGEKISALYAYTAATIQAIPQPYPAFTLIFSSSDGDRAAIVNHSCANTFQKAWDEGLRSHRTLMKRHKVAGLYLRVDWVEQVQPSTQEDFVKKLSRCRRNFFRHGIALDEKMSRIFTEMECNANAFFFPTDNTVEHGELQKKALQQYGLTRFPGKECVIENDALWIISTAGVFADKNGERYPLLGPNNEEGLPALPAPSISWDSRAILYTGIRRVSSENQEYVKEVIVSSSRFLAKEMQKNGRFVYGRLPIGDKKLRSYNTIRHAGTLFAMMEAWQYTQDASIWPAIKKGIICMVDTMIERTANATGESMAFLLEDGGELKLGGCGVALVALAKYAKITQSEQHLELMRALARGVEFMQDAQKGTFVHVLHAHDLTVKEERRIIYYDGEALFGIMQLYALDADSRWLDMARKALDAFIVLEHWKAHDHWLAYAVNEITQYCPEEHYFRFGLRNVGGHIGFISQRETHYPTLLELSMAAASMLKRLEDTPVLHHLLEEFDAQGFYHALQVRAQYVLTAHFWPEMTMYFTKPERMLGSFFIRHHSLRTRIDDVGHYLAGLTAYARWKISAKHDGCMCQQNGDAALYTHRKMHIKNHSEYSTC